MRWVLCLILLALPAAAEEVVLGLSQDEIAITTRFDGSEIFVFGAIKREAPIRSDAPLEVIVTVAGPSEPVMVRRKANRYGIWVNTDQVEVDLAPSFYAVAASGALSDVLSETEDLRHRISVPSAIRSVGAPMDITDAASFTEALIRIREASGQYQLNEHQIELREQTLFQGNIRLPAALTEGAYETRIFLTREGTVVSSYATVIDVRKVGLERWLYNMSRQTPFWYGIMSLAIAIFAGWSASAVFSLIRN